MISTVLVVITLGQGGEAPHVAFSSAADMAACADKAQVVTGVLKGAGYQVAAQRCVESDLAFAPYDHAATVFPHAYRLTVPADPAQTAGIEPIPSLADCTPAPDADPAIWCAVSAQATGLR